MEFLYILCVDQLFSTLSEGAVKKSIAFGNIHRWGSFFVSLCIAVIGLGAYHQPVSAAYYCVPHAGVVCETADIASDVTWHANNIHVVTGMLTIKSGVTLTIESGTIVKFNEGGTYGGGLDVFGSLALPDAGKVTFTSIRDDNAGGYNDTNGDGGNTSAAANDWNTIKIYSSSQEFKNVVVEYANTGLSVINTTTQDINPHITTNTFSNNSYGLYLDIDSNSNITSVIEHNVFTGNDFGFYTELSGSHTGVSLPMLSNNDFNNNHDLPIFLNGSAYPTYVNNTFSGYADVGGRVGHVGIGLGGNFVQDGTWPKVSYSQQDGKILPYVLRNILNVNAIVTIPDGLIIKAYITPLEKDRLWIAVNGLGGKLNAQGKMTFTSWADDLVDNQDTNGDGTDLEPKAFDWSGLYIYNNLNSFDNAVFKYGLFGLQFLNADQTFNVSVTNCVFDTNQNGLGFYAGSDPIKAINAINTGLVGQNRFTHNQGFPIFLEGTSYPTFTSNTFDLNVHPAIGLAGTWDQTGSWPAIVGDGGVVMPYVVESITTVLPTAKITIPAGIVFKFDTPSQVPVKKPLYYLDVQGILDFKSTASSPIVFTSYRDDTYKMDTNSDTTLPQHGDWDSVVFSNPLINIHDLVVRYSKYGFYFANEGTTAYSPPITNVLSDNNIYGMYFIIKSSGNLASSITNSKFTNNDYGLGTFVQPSVTGVVPTGVVRISLNGNTFSKSTYYPIYLGGTAQPVFGVNTFTSNHYRAIGLSGYWNANVTWQKVTGEGITLPYAVEDNVTVVLGATVTIPDSTLIKVKSKKYIEAIGNLKLLSTGSTPITFTSFLDDVYDDTNGDGAGVTVPARGDWDSVYIENNGTTFANVISKYANAGVIVYNGGGTNIFPAVTNNTFQENVHGIQLSIVSTGDITSTISNNVISHNNYGLYTFFDPHSGYGGAFPTVKGNTFDTSSEFPMYFGGTTSVTYDPLALNTFSNSYHKGIGLSGWWGGSKTCTWDAVVGDGGKIFPYVVLGDITAVDVGGGKAVLKLPAGLVVKLDINKSIYNYGLFDLQSTSAKPIYFTSYRDDTIGGDTNADAALTSPAKSDWKTVWVIDTPYKVNRFHDLVVRYATAGLGVIYMGPANTSINTPIIDSTLENNYAGAILAIECDKKTAVDCGKNSLNPNGGAGDITSTLSNLNFTGNDYGLLTFAQDYTTGRILPSLTNVHFKNDLVYPIFLGGTSYPNFVSGNTIEEGSTGVSSMTLTSQEKPTLTLPKMPEVTIQPGSHPADEALLPPPQTSSGGISIIGSIRPPIGLGGVFNNSGTLPQIAGLTYAVVGNYPLTLYLDGRADKVDPNLYIGYQNASGTSMAVQSGTIIKIGAGFKVDAMGSLDVQGTQTDPVIWTSINDDTVGGDTNVDNGTTVPHKGDWLGVYLGSSATNFNHSVLKYATDGLNIHFAGELNQNINPMVTYSTFSQNTTGLTLSIENNGDILSEIHHNIFMDNDTHLLAQTAGGSGHLTIKIYENDFVPATTFGINNLTTQVLDARNNYWGDASGPNNLNTNPNGKGVPVSDRVTFTPWGTIPYNIVTSSSVDGYVKVGTNKVGLQGVTITLTSTTQPTLTAQTDQNGHFKFDNLPGGQYIVTPTLTGYLFTPSSSAVNVPPNNTTPDFIGELQVVSTYILSGKVTDLNHKPVPNARIVIINSLNAVAGEALTDALGQYQITQLKTGVYTVTPSYDPFTFTPVNQQVTLTANNTNVNFTLNGVLRLHKSFLPDVVHK